MGSKIRQSHNFCRLGRVGRPHHHRVNRPSKRRRQAASLQRGFQLTATSPPPGFFVNVASKGFIQAVSLLFATLAARSISVASKGLMGGSVGEKVMGWDGRMLSPTLPPISPLDATL